MSVGIDFLIEQNLTLGELSELTKDYLEGEE